MSKKKQDTYAVSAKLVLYIDLEIGAGSLEEAVSAARDLKVQDFVEIHGDFIDSECPQITGVYLRDVS
jgi:hypothetical protein